MDIKTVANNFLGIIESARSKNTARAYTNAMAMFCKVLEVRGIDTEQPIMNLDEDALSWYMEHLKVYSAATEQLYITAIVRFYEYLSSENIIDVNMHRIRQMVSLRSRKQGQRLPQFPRESIEQVIQYAENLDTQQSEDPKEYLRNLRDSAFILTLADTGLRVHEACKLKRGDLDWFEGKAILIGKGNQEAVVRFSSRAMRAIRLYLDKRAPLDGTSGKPLSSLPLFAQHAKRSGKKVKPITTRTGVDIITHRVTEVLGPAGSGTITPHSFRHYFVTIILVASGGNLKLAQELARHKNIAVTQRYAHLSNEELDRGYHKVFENQEEEHS